MLSVSVVIIAKNEANHIVDCIRSARQVTDNIIIVDTGSADDTAALAVREGATVVSEPWQGYGHARNTGAAAAANNWIIALDADERISPRLAEALKTVSFDKAGAVLYKVKRVNYIGGQRIRFGPHGTDFPLRIYNRQQTEWDLWPVHEALYNKAVTVIKLAGSIIHYSARNLEHYKEKMNWYARLSSRKYYQQGKKATWVKRALAPLFHFVKAYIFQSGFLDGYKGFIIAKTIAHYTFLKYGYLHKLNMAENSPQKTTSLTPGFSAGISIKEKI